MKVKEKPLELASEEAWGREGKTGEEKSTGMLLGGRTLLLLNMFLKPALEALYMLFKIHTPVPHLEHMVSIPWTAAYIGTFLAIFPGDCILKVESTFLDECARLRTKRTVWQSSQSEQMWAIFQKSNAGRRRILILYRN